VQNRQSDYRNAKKNIEPEIVKNAVIKINDTTDGHYNIEWWDTFTGQVIKTETKQASGGSLELLLPEFSRDIACKITGPRK